MEPTTLNKTYEVPGKWYVYLLPVVFFVVFLLVGAYAIDRTKTIDKPSENVSDPKTTAFVNSVGEQVRELFGTEVYTFDTTDVNTIPSVDYRYTTTYSSGEDALRVDFVFFSNGGYISLTYQPEVAGVYRVQADMRTNFAHGAGLGIQSPGSRSDVVSSSASSAFMTQTPLVWYTLRQETEVADPKNPITIRLYVSDQTTAPYVTETIHFWIKNFKVYRMELNEIPFGIAEMSPPDSARFCAYNCKLGFSDAMRIFAMNANLSRPRLATMPFNIVGRTSVTMRVKLRSSSEKGIYVFIGTNFSVGGMHLIKTDWQTIEQNVPLTNATLGDYTQFGVNLLDPVEGDYVDLAAITVD